MEIYTKGSDRFFVPQGSNAAVGIVENLAAYILEKLAFSGADDLWESFQSGISSFVENNGGESNINPPSKQRPKVKEDLKNLLKQNEPIEFVPCGN